MPLTQAATEVFKQAVNNPVRPLDCDLVFFGEPGRDGKRGPYAYTKLWNQARKKAGLSDQEVAAISGHKSMQMLRRYTHLWAEGLFIKLGLIQRL